MEVLNTKIEGETETERQRGIIEEVCSPFADLPYTVMGYEIPLPSREEVKSIL